MHPRTCQVSTLSSGQVSVVWKRERERQQSSGRIELGWACLAWRVYRRWEVRCRGGREEFGKTDRWGFRWNGWNEPFCAAALKRRQWLIIRLTTSSDAFANYSRCLSILSLSAEEGLLSCEKLYWVSLKKWRTWDSLSKGPTAGDSCPKFIANGVKRSSGGYSFALFYTQDRRTSFKSKMRVGRQIYRFPT